MDTAAPVTKTQFVVWLEAGLAAFWQGGATAALSLLGLGGAQLVGLPVHELDWKQCGGVFLSGGLYRFINYTLKHPLVKVPSDDTTPPFKPDPAPTSPDPNKK